MRNHKNIIVTLMHNKSLLTVNLLEDLIRHESENIDDLIVVDNGSDEMEVEMIQTIRPPFRSVVFPMSENLGFTLGANVGLEHASALSQNSLIFLISNDVRIHAPFIKQSEELLLGQGVLLGNRHIAWDTGWNTFSGKTFDYLEGYFLAATNRAWGFLKNFDKNYAPCDMEDVDLSTKAKAIGYKLVSLNNPNIVHLGAGTYGYTPEREAITKRNKKYFEEKWVL